MFPEIEQFGMLLLTVGPILNLSCCLTFHIPKDIYYLYNRQWLCSESLELLGILVLDISLIHMQEFYVLCAEVAGFLILCAAAGLHFEYHQSSIFLLQSSSNTSRILFQVLSQLPSVTIRWDMVHGSECVGLMILILVAFGQYHLKAYHSADDEIEHYPQAIQRLPTRQTSFQV